MESLRQKIEDTQVAAGTIAIIWLAQAGFVFKTSAGSIVYADPYLTDYAQRDLAEYGLGFKRLVPKLIEPEEVDADYVVSTHSHQDHLDMDALPDLLQNPRIHFVGAPDCREGYQKSGVPEERFTIIHEGETLALGDFTLTGVFADHGELAPDALGFLFDFGGIKVWQVGDTAYRPEMWQDIFKENVDVIIPPINGVFGNLDGVEAARLANDAHAKIAMPCHFWMFALHYGNPAEFLDACKELAPEVEPILVTPGELFVYQRSS
jgi:L-ascorbate 6-phosphate lactonase